MAGLYGLGNLFDVIGTKLNLPEFGFSEGLAGGYTSGTRRSPTSVQAFGQTPSMVGPSARNVLGTSTYRAPVPTIYGGTPQNTRSNSGGGGGGGGGGQDLLKAMDQGLIAWDDNLRAMLNAQSGPSDEELNQMYSGAYSALETQQRALEEGQPLLISGIRQSAEKQKVPIEEKRQAGLEEYTTQEQETRKAETSALAQARQLYNELTQYNLARFGSGTSAGPAAAELLGRATSKQFGETTGAATENVQQINLARQKLTEFSDRAISDIDKDSELKIQQADQWLRDRLNEINSNRAMIESDKAARRYEALRARQDFTNQIEMQRQNYLMELTNWKAQQEYAMGQKASGYSLANISPEGITAGASRFQANAPRADESQYHFGRTASGQEFISPQYGGSYNSILGGRIPGRKYIEENGLVIDAETGETVGRQIPGVPGEV